jgi:autotransporter-associated beta strand protein
MKKSIKKILPLILLAQFFTSLAYSAPCTSPTYVSVSGAMSTIISDCSSFVWSSGNVDSNSKTITGDGTAYTVSAPTTGSITLGTFTNTGNINGRTSGSFTVGIALDPDSTNAAVNVTKINNSGTIVGRYGIYIGAHTTLAELFNSGTIGLKLGDVNALWIYGGTVTKINNSGTIKSADTALLNQGTIRTLNNTGTIDGINYGISNAGTITTLNNLQGRGNAVGAIVYTGRLPTNYNIIINSTSQFGRLLGDSASGALNFGIYSGGETGISASTVNVGTYTSVLTGIVSSNLLNRSGTYGLFNWQLVNPSLNNWNLVVTLAASDITTAGTVYESSNLGSTVNPKLDGGTLKISSAGGISSALSITGNHGTIDQNGLASVLSGIISNDVAGTAGKLTIINSGPAGLGSLTLSGANTFTGGVEVQAGANLKISSASALGSGTLALVGTPTTSATLSTTADMTISNPITVKYDPTFNVASGTTTTVTSAIADGGAPGDVVVTGGGTLALTNVNTYSGATTIDAGSRLALTGAGSISASTAVTNNGAFDVTQAAGNVTLGGTYTQGTTGTLKMTLAPVSNQQVNVAGTANLGGTLDLAAAAGTYRAGRYTLMTSAGLGGSTFSALNTNLASVTNYTYRLAYDPSNVYLELRSSAADTMSSIRAMGGDLNKVYNAQYGIAQLGLAYDCKLFDQNNLCLSTGIRTTHSRADGSTYEGVALIAAHRARPDVRVGAWIDQNESRNMVMNVTAGNKSPMLGAFAVWNENPETREGLEVKVSAAYGKKDLSMARPVIGTAENGQGKSTLATAVAEATVGYGLQLDARTSISPFAGLRYANLSNAGYTESADVFSPLTFAKTSQSAKSVIAGINLYDKPEGPIGLDLSAGVERYVSTSAAQLSASGIDGLSPVQMTPVMSQNRPFASASLRYEIDKNQHLLFGLLHSKQFTNSEWVSSATVRYVIGL